MADSDNSRTLSTVTRGEFHSAVATCLSDLFVSRMLSGDTLGGLEDEPLLSLWHQWRQARDHALDLNRQQQELEAKVFSIVGASDLSSEGWKAADREIGHSKALEAEDRAFESERALAHELRNMPANSLTSAIAKRHAILVRGQPSATHDEYPWPQVRSVLVDFLTLDMHIGSGERNQPAAALKRPERRAV